MSSYGPPPGQDPNSEGQPPQGQPGYGAPQGQPPDNYLVWAILCTVLCCLPLGIFAIVFATQVNSKWSMGDYAGALDASNKAKQFAKWGAIIGGIGIVLIIALGMVFIFALAHPTSHLPSTYPSYTVPSLSTP